MYVAKYLLYSYWLLTIILGLLNVALLFFKCKKQSVRIITIKYEDSSCEIYTALKSVGVTMDSSQKQAFEDKIENNYNNKKMGFGR